MYYFTLGCLSMLAGASPSASVFAPSAVLNDGTKMPLVSLGGGYDKNQTEESIAEVGNQPHVCCTATHTRACAARIFGPNSCCSARLALALALACIRLYFTDSISPRKYILPRQLLLGSEASILLTSTWTKAVWGQVSRMQSRAAL